jgi:hypothetical protein
VRQLAYEWFSELDKVPADLLDDEPPDLSPASGARPAKFVSFFENSFSIKQLSNVLIESAFIELAAESSPPFAVAADRAPFQFTVKQCEMGLALVVKHFTSLLFRKMQERQTPLPVPAQPALSPFKLLLAAAQSRETNDKPAYEWLLSPEIVSGAEPHAHHIYGWHGVLYVRHKKNWPHSSTMQQ